MAWRIIPQTEKRGRGRNAERVTVLCKHIQFFPKKDQKTGAVVGFGRFGFPILSVVIADERGYQHKITWSNRTRTPLTEPNPGKFVYHWPDRYEHPTITVGTGSRRRSVPDTLSPKRLVSGERDEWESHTRFWAWLEHRIGAVAEEVRAVMADRMVEVLTPAAEQPGGSSGDRRPKPTKPLATATQAM